MRKFIVKEFKGKRFHSKGWGVGFDTKITILTPL